MKFFLRIGFSGKLALAFAGLLSLLGCSIFLLVSQTTQRYFVRELTLSMESQALLVADLIPSSLFEKPDPIILRDLVERAAFYGRARVTVVKLNGDVLQDSQVEPLQVPKMDNHLYRPEFSQAFKGQTGSSIRHSDTLHREFLYVAVAKKNQGQVIGAVRLAMDLTDVHKRVERVNRAIAAITVLFVALSILVAMLLSRSLSRPVAEIARAAQEMAQGRYEARARVVSHDEHGSLARVLNQMAERIAVVVAELSREKSQISAVLSHMQEAVIAVDQGGKIIFVNPAMADLLSMDVSRALGVPFLEILRHAGISQMLERVLHGEPLAQAEVVIRQTQERIFQCRAVPIKQDENLAGVLLVLHEVTVMRHLEQVRRDFVANVSHELKTPLASIKGYAETLRLGAIDDQENRLEFLQTIEKHADHLSRLSDELLELSTLESGRPIRKERVNFVSVVKEAVEAMRPLVQKAGIHFETIFNMETLELDIDADLMRRAIISLLDNAVKFNQPKGFVRVVLNQEGNQVLLDIIDSGMGVAPEDLPRIFERFYRTDAARSSRRPGTGLGLSLVKHIMHAHGGHVDIKSKVNEGTTISLTLPTAA